MRHIKTSFIASIILLFFLPATVPALSLTAQSGNKISKEEALDAIGSKVVSFSLIDQDGNRFKLKEFFGKPFAVTFIYTTCPTICPTLLLRLKEARQKAGDRFGREFRFLTVGFDVENDSPEVLKSFGENFTDDFDNWKFVTAKTPQAMQDFVKRFGFGFNKASIGYAHLTLTTVVGKDGTIMDQIFGDDYDPQLLLNALKLTSPQYHERPILSPGGWIIVYSMLISIVLFGFLLYHFILKPLKQCSAQN